VIVPVYNVERYLDCCLDSIRGQSYERLEIIVVEDCSTDDSLSMLERHLADPRVQLLQHTSNAGLSAARNAGIEAATGEFILFVDSDDAIAPALIETCLADIRMTGADVVVFDFVAFNDGEETPVIGQVVDTTGAKSLGRVEYFKQPHFAWLKFIRADLLRDPRLRFPVGLYYEDWPFHWELGFSSASIRHLGGHWYCYRQRGRSITASTGGALLDQFRVQQMVLDTVSLRGGRAEATVLLSKANASFWSVLTRIDANCLAEALTAARELRRGLQSLGPSRPSGVRATAVTLLLALPAPLMGIGVRVLRGVKGAFRQARPQVSTQT